MLRHGRLHGRNLGCRRGGTWFLNWRLRDRFLRLGRWKRLGMLGLDLDNRRLELVELTLQHFLRRTRVHGLELAAHGTARLVVDLDPHFRIVVREAVHGPTNDCYKIRHQNFLIMSGKLFFEFKPERLS